MLGMNYWCPSTSAWNIGHILPHNKSTDGPVMMSEIVTYRQPREVIVPLGEIDKDPKTSDDEN